MLAQDKTNLSGKQIGNYKVKELLHVGKGSTLYHATDTKLEEDVFITILQTSNADNPDLAAQFDRRMEALGQIKHANIATVTDINVTKDGYPYAVIEYVDGATLASQIASHEQQDVLLSAEDALHIGRQLASALSVAHPSGLIDNDLRPENIYMRDEKTPVFIDLGVPPVTSRPETVLNGSQTPMLDYASPEELEGKALSRRSNIYSLGIIFYELLTNHRPELPASSWDIFERSSMPKEVALEEAREGLSGETYRLVRNCLWRQEWSRFETADEVITAIDTAVLAEQAPAKKSGILAPSRRPAWIYAAIPVAIILFGLLGYAIFSSMFNGGGATPTPRPTLASPTEQPASGAVGTNTFETTTPTFEAPPTSKAPRKLIMYAPGEDEFVDPEKPLIFRWLWPRDLIENEAFILLTGEENFDEDAQQQLSEFARTIESDANGQYYSITIPSDEMGFAAGSYLYQIRLVDTNTSEIKAESDQGRFIILDSTSTPTNTPEPTATSTLTAAECEPTRLPGWVLHTVKTGESISLFSQQANVTVKTILDANCLPNNVILSVGQQLFIPPPLATYTPTPSPLLPTPTPGSNGGGSSGGGSTAPTAVAPTFTPLPRPTSTPLPPPT